MTASQTNRTWKPADFLVDWTKKNYCCDRRGGAAFFGRNLCLHLAPQAERCAEFARARFNKLGMTKRVTGTPRHLPSASRASSLSSATRECTKSAERFLESGGYRHEELASREIHRGHPRGDSEDRRALGSISSARPGRQERDPDQIIRD